MEKHRTIAGYIVLAWGVLVLLVGIAFAVGMVGGGMMAETGSGEGAVLAGVGGIMGLLIILLAALFIAGGFGFAQGRPWARPLMWIAAVLSLFSIPIGTAIGAYTIWVLVKKA
jgi:hypothetical protein